MSMIQTLGAAALAMSDGLYYSLMVGGLVVVGVVYFIVKKKQS